MSMARDELADRVRDRLPRGLHCIEKKMFGGIAFMAHGNMLVCPLKDGSLMVRVGKEAQDEALAISGAERMEMNGRSISGFVLVAGDALEDDDVLQGWIDRAWNFVRTLPGK